MKESDKDLMSTFYLKIK